MTRPLRVNRMSLRKDGKNPNLPWVFLCGCGLRSQMRDYEQGLYKLRHHDCYWDFHP